MLFQNLTLSLLGLLATAGTGWVLARLGIRLLKRLLRGEQADNYRHLLDFCRKPLQVLVPLLLLLPLAPWLAVPEDLWQFGQHLYKLLLIASITWLLIRGILALKVIILKNYDVNASDNLKARAMHTQVNVLVKITCVLTGFFGLACLLMTFEAVRQIGVSLLASAGIAGIIIGFAAQRSLATLFAGIQLAFSQPIRVDDVVIIEGEWGRVEEITLTYVVVCIWDQRRLIVPISQVLEKPFQNWTRVSAELLGSVYLYTDYRVDVEDVREQLQRILKQTDLWDGRVAGLQVTDSTEKCMVLRALMSAADSSDAWNLRCFVREKLIAYMQETYPQSLPRQRAEVELREVQPHGTENRRETA